MTTVLVFGVFDLLHPGHESFLRSAAALGDRLVVIIARDQNVEQRKGRRPAHDEQQRLEQVRQFVGAQFIAPTDVRLGYADWSQHEQVLDDIKPHIIALGYDQQPTLPAGPWQVVHLEAFRPDIYKSSLMRVQQTEPEHEDKQFIADSKQNPQAFSQLYEKYVDKIFQFCYYRVGQDRALAEDLTAEIFTRSLQALPKFQWQGHPYSAYLYRVARTVCAAHYAQPRALDIDTIAVSDTDTAKQTTAPDALLLWKQIATLPKETQELFELRYLEDLSYDEIAQIVGKSSGSIRTALSRAIKKLQHYYAEQ